MSFRHLPILIRELDRHALKRDDSVWTNEQLYQSETRILARWKNRYPTDEQGHIQLLSKIDVEWLTSEHLTYFFLGEVESDHGNHMLFTTEITTPQSDLDHWLGLRHTPLDDPSTSLLFYAQALLNWQKESSFCSRCGSPLVNHDGGNRQICGNSQCELEVFPRINPAVIVLLTHDDQCLLAHARKFQGDIPMHSCLAGFMETGEDFEQTLRREMYEEVGVHLDEIIYKGNQPWPFPQSLMIGFHASTTNKELTFHDGEITSATWFTVEDLHSAVLKNMIRLPSPKSISYYLVQDWFDERSDTPLADVIAEAKKQKD